MALMNPMLRLRRVVKSLGADDERADEFVDAMDAYPTRRESDERMEAMFNRFFTRMLLAMIVIAGIAIAIVEAIN